MVLMAASSSSRSQAQSLQAKRRAASMNYNCSIRSSFKTPSVLRQPICRDDDADTRGHRVDQAEVRERAAIGEQAASLA